jgi:hypothetical protein
MKWELILFLSKISFDTKRPESERETQSQICRLMDEHHILQASDRAMKKPPRTKWTEASIAYPSVLSRRSESRALVWSVCAPWSCCRLNFNTWDPEAGDLSWSDQWCYLSMSIYLDAEEILTTKACSSWRHRRPGPGTYGKWPSSTRG